VQEPANCITTTAPKPWSLNLASHPEKVKNGDINDQELEETANHMLLLLIVLLSVCHE
jgi:hypothetical protein